MGSVKLLRPQSEPELSPREKARKDFMDGVMKRADGIAFNQDNAVVATTKHLVYAMVYELSEAFLSSQELVHAVNNLSKGLAQANADLEALRRAVKNGN